ncbi:hypothetical protein BT96DRAFT_1014547 [Gymnopus androsaceus JB14]|uniref:RING-type domain-containing protein n=1 Tax=Gymnopus androsaceus JB14 TaxID=1447944 RepID=A0A6A4I826_9AGAR|nr:hypothetical protein BT96DRAFT_1014547 [Gymnopus androsaceus JB14]
MRLSTLLAISTALFACLTQAAPFSSLSGSNAELELRAERLARNQMYINGELLERGVFSEVKRRDFTPIGGLTIFERDLLRRTDECGVCLEKVRKPEKMVNLCENKGEDGASHEICHKCMENWIMKQGKESCPVCRGELWMPYEERVCKSRTPSPEPEKTGGK